MKNIGILFDVSGSMKEKFDNYYIEKKEQNESNEKRADEIIKILENISKNLNVQIFSILFGLLEPPLIVDFIRLLKISSEKFDELESNIDNNNEKKYREELINLLSHDEEGNERYCNIREYIYGKEGPSERFSEFVVKLMKKERKIIDEIYSSLPRKVKDKFYDNTTWGLNQGLNVVGGTFIGGGGAAITTGGMIACSSLPKIVLLAHPLLMPIVISTGIAGVFSSVGLYIKSIIIDINVEEETINAIKNGFRSCIKNISSNIMDIYKKKEKEIKLIEGSELLNLIQNLKDNIEYPKNEKNKSFDIIDIFEDYIYGDTPLYTSCQKAFGVFEKNSKNKNYLIIISDGLLNDIKNYDEAIYYTKKKITEK